MSETILEYTDVCFAYEREEVLHNVSLTVERGSLVAVVGPNGGGKSTLIKLALGLLQPVHGTVHAFGRSPAAASRHVGYVPQHLSYDPQFPVSALDVVLMGRAERHLWGPYRRDDHAEAMRALEQVRLADLAGRSFGALSGGERQRILIAQALASNPELLLLDEPTANVDSTVEHEIYELLHRLHETITIIVVSHNLNVVTRHATHIVCVNRTASILPTAQLSEDAFHAVRRGDLAMLQHGQHCHVIDPSKAMQAPHRTDTGEETA